MDENPVFVNPTQRQHHVRLLPSILLQSVPLPTTTHMLSLRRYSSTTSTVDYGHHHDSSCHQSCCTVVIYSDDADLLPLRHTCTRLHCPIASHRPLSNVSMSEPPDNVTIAPVTPDASFAKLAWTPSTPILAAITQQPPSNVVYAVAAAPAPIDLLQTLEPSSDNSDCCPRRSVAVHPATTNVTPIQIVVTSWLLTPPEAWE